jgi:hypothetical protein
MRSTLTICSLLSMSLLLACVPEMDEATPPSSGEPPQQTYDPAPGQRVISRIEVKNGTLTFETFGDGFAILEQQRPGTEPILSKDMDGLTLAELHRQLAPGQPVPEELARSNVRYQASPREFSPEPGFAQSKTPAAGVGAPLPTDPPTLALDDGYADFERNHCYLFYANGFRGCWRNQGGPSYNWVWGWGWRSEFWLLPFTGDAPAGITAFVDGSLTGRWSFPVGVNSHLITLSAENFWNCRPNKEHRYNITHTEPTRFHIGLSMNVDDCPF